MRTTVTLDDDLLAKARDFSGIQETSALLQSALKRMVESEASRRLARFGGSSPKLKSIPRRRSEVVGDSR
ncbi:MAG: type II toxin-antitoxin system VapB family antitoxin [Zoogloeaceae bacterium]|jgi:Arc/MetJ family transcription regulator|nr:type II toxin-antitoxin system VapB family antitoxin [Zoogloeaceae bacterium]